MSGVKREREVTKQVDKKKRNPKYPKLVAEFNPQTDKCLRYFSTNEAFVRVGNFGSYKLYCDNGKSVPIFISADGFLYIYPAFKSEHETYVEAFLHDYAPNYPFSKAKRYTGTTHYEFIANKELVRA